VIRENPTLRAVITEARAQLERAGVDSPALSAEILAAHTLGMRRLDVLVHPNKVLTPAEAVAVQVAITRRAAGEPVAYILGEKEFYGLDFTVSSAVLVPRPETEHIVEDVEAHFAADAPLRFADLGTGSGCLAVTVAHLFANARGVALDMSADALAVARANAVRHGVADRVAFVRGDFAQPFAAAGSLDLVVSNPPYVSEAEYRELDPEVSQFEPRTALVPDGHVESDGLECVRALLPQVARALRPGGLFLMEFGWTQGEAVRRIVEGQGAFSSVTIRRDLAGKDRYVLALRSEKCV
jgi:release factor glutamine methyltransferase